MLDILLPIKRRRLQRQQQLTSSEGPTQELQLLRQPQTGALPPQVGAFSLQGIIYTKSTILGKPKG